MKLNFIEIWTVGVYKQKKIQQLSLKIKMVLILTCDWITRRWTVVFGTDMQIFRSADWSICDVFNLPWDYFHLTRVVAQQKMVECVPTAPNPHHHVAALQ